jgi:hypothetical protein
MKKWNDGRHKLKLLTAPALKRDQLATANCRLATADWRLPTFNFWSLIKKT